MDITFTTATDGPLVVTPAVAVMIARAAQRVAIVGQPGSGKTTLAALLADRDTVARETLHTDAGIDDPWSVQRACVATWAAERKAWTIEGITAARCLKHREIDADIVLWCRDVHVDRGTRASALGRSVEAWMTEWAEGWAGSPAAPAVLVVRGPLPPERVP